MIEYSRDPKNSTRKLTSDKQLQQSDRINKSVAFLYSKDKQAEKEISEMTPFTIVTNNIKHLGVTLAKQVKDLYDRNFKSLKKEIKEELRRWKDSHVHG